MAATFKRAFYWLWEKANESPLSRYQCRVKPIPQDYYPEHYELKKSFTARAVTGKEYVV